MAIFREHCPGAQKCVLRSDTYEHSLASLEQLFKEAKRDFPYLTVERVQVTQFAGPIYARTYGIEFVVRDGEDVPAEYRRVSELQGTF